MNSNLNNDTGDLVLQLRNNGTGTELCMIIDGDYYSMGNKVLNAANFSSYALPLAGGTMNGTIWSAHVYPKTTLSYNFGSSEYEYNATFSRTIFVRHIEPAKNVNDDIYLNYGSRNGCVRVWSALSMEGVASIHNLPIDGGIFWNPYVESAEDNSDAASITLHANGVGGGTELRLTMANDPNDVINLNPASWVYLKSKATFRVDDSWLRINETGSFASGIYCGGSILRTDNVLQVGNNGSAFYALSDGRLYCSYHAQIGSSLSLWTDVEGGNINIKSGNGHTNSWEIDSYNGDLRLYTWRESDGAYLGTTLYQEDGCWSKARWARNSDYSTVSYFIESSSGGFRNSSLSYLCTNNAFDYANWQYDIIMDHGASDYRTILQFPYWGSPRYRKKEGDIWGNYQDFITSENYTSYCIPANAYISTTTNVDGDAILKIHGRADLGCLLLTNEGWAGYGWDDPYTAGLSQVIGRVYFKLG